MLEFAHKPPRSPEDVSLSETGKVLLESRQSQDQISGLGQAACSELVDAFGESGPPRSPEGGIVLAEASGFLIEAAELLNSSDMNAFTTGLNLLRKDLSEVPA